MFIHPGQVVSFVYNKGSVPGSRRLVKVSEVDKTFIKGEDLTAPEDDRFRQFKKSEIANIPVLEIVADVYEEFIPLDSILKADTSHLGDSQILALFNVLYPNRKGVRYHAAYKGVVVRRDDLPCIEFVIGETQTTIEFVNENGQRLGISFNHPNRVGPSLDLPHHIVGRVDSTNMREFVTKLASHINGTSKPVTSVDGWANHCAAKAASGNPFYAGVST